MVDHPDPDAPDTATYDRGTNGMPERTRRAFQSHADTQLGDRPERARREIERAFRASENAAVACSGGKDSTALLVLASESDADHRVFHWDWGARLAPRPIEREIVGLLRSYASDDRVLVASRRHPTIRPFPEHDAFRAGLHAHDGITDPDGSLDRLAGVLARTDRVGRQVVGLRRAESGSRERSIDGLWGESLGQPAAFPIREWSARDVWALLVDRDVDYLGYYDRVAHATGDGSPRDYEAARFATVHDPEFDDLSADSLAAWRWHDVKRPD